MRDWTPIDAADAADDARAREWWQVTILTPKRATCADCREEIDGEDVSVEEFETTAELICRDCAEARNEARQEETDA